MKPTSNKRCNSAAAAASLISLIDRFLCRIGWKLGSTLSSWIVISSLIPCISKGDQAKTSIYSSRKSVNRVLISKSKREPISKTFPFGNRTLLKNLFNWFRSFIFLQLTLEIQIFRSERWNPLFILRSLRVTHCWLPINGIDCCVSDFFDHATNEFICRGTQ